MLMGRTDLCACHFVAKGESVWDELALLEYVNLGLLHVVFWFPEVLLFLTVHDSQACLSKFSVVVDALNAVAFGALII